MTICDCTHQNPDCKRCLTCTELEPATPTLSDLIDARIIYVHARPYQRSPMIETGTVKAYKVRHDGSLVIFIKPDKPHLIARWRDEGDLLHYLPQNDAFLSTGESHV